jgi:hypothetical protein
MRGNNDQRDFFGSLTPKARIVQFSAEIAGSRPDKVAFQHSILCQVGLPRSPTNATRFERSSGSASILVESGSLWNGQGWVQQPLPCGAKPRLALVHIASEAIRTQSATIDVGRSTHEFMKRLGIDTNGRSYASFRQQLAALSACRMTLGFERETVDSKPIERFRAWSSPDAGLERELDIEPGVIVLSHQFFDSLREHAVPLDPRAVTALQKSSLALDIYTWLAHRLHRVDRHAGERVSWNSLRTQFGQEYGTDKNFRRKLTESLRAVRAVYPEARVDEVQGALVLLPSPPPVAKTLVAVPRKA